MTVAEKAAWDDTVLPFQLDRSDIRGRVARLDATLDRILTLHNYPAPVQSLVAEAALLTSLIGQAIKLRWKLSLQIRGDGPVRLIATDYFAPEQDGEAARIRAWASYDETLPEAFSKPFSLLGSGYFGILIDQGPDMQPYQGLTPLAGGSLGACASTYFAQSEQLPTRFELGAALATEPGKAPAWRAGGVMVQHMPKSQLEARDGGSGDGGLLTAADLLGDDDEENWNRVSILLQSAELTELVGPHLTSADLLLRLFHEETPRVYDAQSIRFGCTCTEQKVADALAMYDESELAEMTNESGKITANCQFCGNDYTLDPRNLPNAPKI